MKDYKSKLPRIVQKDGQFYLYNHDGTRIRGISFLHGISEIASGFCSIEVTIPVVVIADENFKIVD
jgi:hypothetical protein